MKILIAADIFPPDIGGPATYSKNLAQELQKQGHKVAIICYGEKDKKTDFELNFPVFRISRRSFLPFRYLDYFLTLLKIGDKFDFFYAMGPVSAGLPTMLAAKVLRKKYLLKVVGDYAWEQARTRGWIVDDVDEFQKKKYFFKVGVFRWVQKKTAKEAEKIIVPSQYLKNMVAGWGVDLPKIDVIYNSVDFKNIFLIDKKIAQEKIGISGEIVFSLGRLVPWKGFGMLIKIWPQILKKKKNLKLVIGGSGPEEKKLKKIIKKYGLEDSVFLVGKIPRKNLFVYFSAADIFVLNSGYEGLPHVLLEALAYRLPVIASDKGGNKEVIKNNYNGLLVKYNQEKEWISAILGLVENESLKRKFAVNSRYDLEKFKYKTMLKKTLNILNSAKKL